MIATLEQYEFLYLSLVDYMDIYGLNGEESFNHYQNGSIHNDSLYFKPTFEVNDVQLNLGTNI